MSNLEIYNFDSKKSERKRLLQEFEQIAYKIYPHSGLLSLILSLRTWLGLNITVLIQRLGYNKKKISLFQDKPIVLNIGCQGSKSKDSNCVDTDLLIGNSILKFILGKLDYDLLLNITYHDRNLLGVADGILISHVLEHIPPTLVITALKNCFAYLKVGGCIRVSVPNLALYDQPSFPGSEKIRNRMLAKNLVLYGWGHKFMYDAKLLTVLMEEAGFSEVEEVTYGKGLLGEQDPPKHKNESMYLTGIKI